MKKYAVFLSRFSPLHLGHQKIIDKMIADNSIENCIIMIGSSNVHNDRTPFTFETRKKMVETIYPKIKVIPIPDINPYKDLFETKTLETWRKSIKKIETKLEAEFTFYGGSRKDINYLDKDFKAIVAIDRKNGLKISGTKIRKTLVLNDQKSLLKLLNPKVIPIAVKAFKDYLFNEVVIGFKS